MKVTSEQDSESLVAKLTYPWVNDLVELAASSSEMLLRNRW